MQKYSRRKNEWEVFHLESESESIIHYPRNKMYEDLLFLTLETSKAIPNYAKLFMPKLSTTFGMITIFF